MSPKAMLIAVSAKTEYKLVTIFRKSVRKGTRLRQKVVE
jgi:hypothetical protein